MKIVYIEIHAFKEHFEYVCEFVYLCMRTLNISEQANIKKMLNFCPGGIFQVSNLHSQTLCLVSDYTENISALMLCP